MRNYICSFFTEVKIRLGLTLMVTVFIFGYLLGQKLERSLISNLGLEIKNTQLIIDFSLGETVVEYGKSPSLLISCGFHQGSTLATSIHTTDSPLNDLLIYPNPTIEWIQIENPVGSELKYKICDISGRAVKSGKTEGKIHTLDVGFLDEGIYILTISDASNNALSLKFIKI